MLGLGALPAAVQFVAFLFMPESPRWLITKRRDSEAKEVLAKLRGASSLVEEEYEGIRSGILCVMEEMKHRGGQRELLLVHVVDSRWTRSQSVALHNIIMFQ